MNKNIVTKKLIMYIAQHHSKRANNHKEANLVSYRLCGCAFGALINVIWNCSTSIKHALLHLGQKSRKFLRMVSSLILSCVVCLVSANGATDKICYSHIHFSSRSLSCFFFLSRYLRMSLFRAGIPIPSKSTTAKIVKSIQFTSHFFIFHNLHREPDRHSIHNNHQRNRKSEKQHR